MPFYPPPDERPEGDKWREHTGGWRLNRLLEVLIALCLAWTTVGVTLAEKHWTDDGAPILSYTQFEDPIEVVGGQVVVSYHTPGLKNGSRREARLSFVRIDPLPRYERSYMGAVESVEGDRTVWRVPESDFENGATWTIRVLYVLEDLDGFPVTRVLSHIGSWRKP